MPPTVTLNRLLVVAEPWASLLVGGDKTWELRTTSTNVRGPVGIAAKGTGTIIGRVTRGPSTWDLIPVTHELHAVRYEWSTVTDESKLCTATIQGEPCARPVAVKSAGLCGMHYQRSKNGIPMDAAVGAPKPKKKCTATNEGERCDRDAIASGLCSGHYQRQKNGFPMDGPWREKLNDRPCGGTFEDEPCHLPVHALGLCIVHYDVSAEAHR